MLPRTLILGLLLACSCASPASREETERTKDTFEMTPQRSGLKNFVAQFAIRIERAADQIRQESEDPSVDRDAVFWKMSAIPQARRALGRADEEAGLMDLWLLCTRAATLLRDDEVGRTFFGAATPIALEAAEGLEQMIQELARALLSEDEFQLAQEAIVRHASEGEFNAFVPTIASSDGPWAKTMSAVLGKPLGVVSRPLGYVDPTAGLGATAAAAFRVAAAVDRARTDINYLPDQIRWQTELMLLELEENPASSRTLDSWEKVGAASESIAATAASLPGDLRSEIETLVVGLEEEQASLRATLVQVDTTVANIDGALEDVERIVASTDGTARSLTTMAESYTVLAGAVSAFMLQVDPPADPAATPEPEPSEAGESGPPFDINDYGTTAARLTETATALTAMLAELQAVTGSDQSQALLDSTEAIVSAAMDELLLKGCAFVLFIALVAMAYRLVAARVFGGRGKVPAS